MNPFKNYTVQAKLVKTNAQDAEAPVAETATVDPVQISQIATDITMKAIGAIGIAFAANRLLSTVCEIAVVVTKAKLK